MVENNTIISTKTSHCIDDIETLPEFSKNGSTFFATAGYDYNEQTKTRTGNISVCRFYGNELTTLSNVSFPDSGILDIEWSKNNQFLEPILLSASSSGFLEILKFNPVDNLSKLSSIFKQKIRNSIALCLSSCNSQISLGFSDGFAANCFQNELDIFINNNWKAHQNEIWTISADNFIRNLLYTGSDDTEMKLWDLNDLKGNKCAQKIKFDAGVCSIAPNPFHEHLLAVGGYGQKVFFYDKRNFNSALSSVSINGGIWRLKWHKNNPNSLLVSGMRSGCHILTNCPASKISFTYSKHCDEAKSTSEGSVLIYASDWLYQKTNSHSPQIDLVVSSAYYQKEIKIWSF